MRARFLLIGLFLLALGYAQFHDPAAAHVEIVAESAADGRTLPARIYLFKNDRPFRLSPVESLLPLRVDTFYRERLWKRSERPRTLEVTANDESHFFLLDGKAEFELPAGNYRVEAYRGFFFAPASEEFALRAGEKRQVRLKLAEVAPAAQAEWLSGDDHIHLVRAAEDNDVFLRWLRAEDLSVGNFLQLQRQVDAAPQYAFGREGEARLPGYSIRSGHESRSEFYGHVNLLGPSRLVRPLSVGSVYANTPEAYPFPYLLFQEGRKLGATTGYAHFNGSQKHSTLLMDLALGSVDFIEVHQFGVLKTREWYQLLNAGLRVTGIAGSDFPVPFGRFKPWPRAFPLLGPERTLVKSPPGESAYEAWAAGVRSGKAVVSNGPLLDFSVKDTGTGAEGTAAAWFHRRIEKIEIVRNGQVVASRAGNATTLTLPFRVDAAESSWIAARAYAPHKEGEPEIVAHTNPVYLLREGKPVYVAEDREAVAKLWQAEMEYYRSSALTFANDGQRRELLSKTEEAARILAAPSH
ncbi:MAG: CehA/McbA family metallohydrolase [Bryobacteraceae bacterium]